MSLRSSFDEVFMVLRIGLLVKVKIYRLIEMPVMKLKSQI